MGVGGADADHDTPAGYIKPSQQALAAGGLALASCAMLIWWSRRTVDLPSSTRRQESQDSSSLILLEDWDARFLARHGKPRISSLRESHLVEYLRTGVCTRTLLSHP
ncbi:hypothetical protein ACKKBG_A31565 [Auxenochlorella protothecoides x Auxenochlorella symbiontica]